MKYSLASKFQGGLLSIGDSTLAYLFIQQLIGVETAKIEPRLSFNDNLPLAIVPIAIFYHENPPLLKMTLTQLFNYWGLSTETQEDLLLWSYAITLSMREKIDSFDWLSQLLAYPDFPNTSLGLALQQLDLCRKSHQSLWQIVENSWYQKLESKAIAIACYCFASTPDSPVLSYQRAMTLGEELGAASLTLSLAGAYNGYSSLPMAWKITPLGQTLYTKANELLAVWSGIKNPASVALTSTTAIAPVGILRKRPHLNINLSNN